MAAGSKRHLSRDGSRHKTAVEIMRNPMETMTKRQKMAKGTKSDHIFTASPQALHQSVVTTAKCY